MVDLYAPNQKPKSEMYIINDLKELEANIAEYSNLEIEETELRNRTQEKVVHLSVMETSDNSYPQAGWIVIEKYFEHNDDMVRSFVNS